MIVPIYAKVSINIHSGNYADNIVRVQEAGGIEERAASLYCSLKCTLALSEFKKSIVPALIESVGTITTNLKIPYSRLKKMKSVAKRMF
jgi:hypothetical protein